MQSPRCLRPFAPHVRSLTAPNIPSDALRDEPPAEAMSRLDVDHNHERWRSIDALLRRDGRFTGPDFEPGDDVVRVLRDHVRVLVVGAGGLGCELLKGLGACRRATDRRTRRTRSARERLGHLSRL